MTADFDLRTTPREDHRQQVFAALDDTDVGESVTIVTEHDLEVLLHHYQIKRHHRLEWHSSPRADEARAVQVTKEATLGEDELTEFDVREMPPQQRHSVLTDTFDRLEPDEGFVLVNDHDPKPLYHELKSTRGEIFDWEYTKRDASEWKVEIVKTETAASPEDDVAARFDVRDIPKQERHPTIHHRYGNIAPGETIEIVAPHEPRPLHREFQDRYGDAFTWTVVEDEPGRARVRITKTEPEDEASSGSTGDSAGTDSLTVTTELDVRDLPPAHRHEQIFDAYAGLQTGEGFVLVNDHDPKPLYHQFDAEAGDEFYWEYRQRDPGEFRALIGKSDRPGGETASPSEPDSPF